MTEKIRQLLVAKKDHLLTKTDLAGDPDARALVEWVEMQTAFRLPLDGVANDFKARMARTLVNLFGDPILYEFYKSDAKFKFSDVALSEKMIDEIMFDTKVNVKRHLKDGDMFGEQAFLRES